MKMMNKVGALLLSAVLCVGMAAPAFAYGGDPVEEVEQSVLTDSTEEDAVTVTDETSGRTDPGGQSDTGGRLPHQLFGRQRPAVHYAGQQVRQHVLSVIDRNAKGQQTVHFMNLVDESDLLALMEDEDADAYTAEKEAAAQAELERKQAEEEAKKAAEEATASGTEQSKENKITKYAATFLGVIALVALAAGGSFYAFMKQKQKKQAEKEALDLMRITPRTRAILRFLWRMSRIRMKSRTSRNPKTANFQGGVCRRTYINTERIGVDAYCLIA